MIDIASTLPVALGLLVIGILLDRKFGRTDPQSFHFTVPYWAFAAALFRYTAAGILVAWLAMYALQLLGFHS